MAKAGRNVLLNGIVGTIGDQLVIKRGRGCSTIISKKPTFSPDRVFTQAQLARQEAFRAATAYAKAKKHEPVYLALAEGTEKTGYNVAVADWLHPPQILQVDLGGWTAGSGGPIRVRAQDDVRVTEVRVKISDETGTLLEEGQAQEAGGLWWEYSPSQTPGGGKQVTVSVRDLPGHTTESKT
jgi:hypothetical protein